MSVLSIQALEVLGYRTAPLSMSYNAANETSGRYRTRFTENQAYARNMPSCRTLKFQSPFPCRLTNSSFVNPTDTF